MLVHVQSTFAVISGRKGTTRKKKEKEEEEEDKRGGRRGWRRNE